MQPQIKTLPETKLVGISIEMSIADVKTAQLWQSFMPRRKEITDTADNNTYSLEVYPSTSFFSNFNPTTNFTKWATVRVSDFNTIPEGMETLVVPKGEYAVFTYRGKPSEAQPTYQYIYSQWIPQSEYELDNRPHMAIMDERYKGEHPDSEEELWIPIKRK